jgi:hypothetical protein
MVEGHSDRKVAVHVRSRVSLSLMIRATLLATALAALLVEATEAQSGRATGLELAGLPTLSFDSDEGVGYGAIAEIYDYGDGTPRPYKWTLQPKVLITTRGRRDVTLFMDAPDLLPEGWRVNGFLGYERRIVTPFYGIGNETTYDASLDDPDGPNPHYYAFGRLRKSALFNLQRNLPGTPLWALFGGGLVNSEIDPTPENDGTTLYATELGAAVETYWTNYVRAGLIWDTRDRESAPTEGVWSEVVFHWVTESLGADVDFTRWSVTDRRYYSLTDRLVLANRLFLQGINGDAPVHQLQRVQTSFKQGEGLGGLRTLRGISKNRYAGKGMFVWNAELRLRVVEFAALGRSFHGAVSGFLDQGRVWSGGVRPRELLSDLHRGYGVGLHLGMGENFVATLDVAHSSEEDGYPIYVALGYLF